jgi:hypothetical protein
MSAQPVILAPSDEPALVDYFDVNPDETSWLRIAWFDGGARFAALRPEGGAITAIAAQAKDGVLQLHAGEALPELARAALRPGEPVVAVAGPPEQVKQALKALDLESRPVERTSREIMMALDLDQLILPELLSRPGIVVRLATEADVPLLTRWRIQYFGEVHKLEPAAAAVAEVKASVQAGRTWVLEDNGAVVNTACFFAVWPKLVHVEYAYSPPELRAQKYGRSAVAGALFKARQTGVRRAVFNTFETNVAVQTGIHPIGFRTTAKFHVVIFVR